MKLLVISQYFYPEPFRVSDVCFKLAAMGHEVSVLTGLPNYPAGEIFAGYDWTALINHQRKASAPEDGVYIPHLNIFYEEINGVKVYRCRLFPRKKGKLNLVRNYVSFAWQATKAVRAMLPDSHDFDKIMVFQYSPVTMAIPGILFRKKLGKPLILYCFDLWPESIVSAGLPNHGLLYGILLMLSRWIYKKADILLVSSRNFGKYFKNKLGIKTPVHYLPIYAEDLFTEAGLEPAGTEASSQDVNLVFAGNIGEMQSMDTIIGAADIVRGHADIRFHIVGDGSALDKSIRLVKDLALENVTFHGRHPLEEMPKYYAMADAFLVTLKKDDFISYTLPGKIQSYMAFGKPILAAIDGEGSDVIRDAGCGLCCEAEDHHALAQIILQFAREKENRQKYGDCSKAYYQDHFSAESFMKSFLGFLQ